MQPNEISYIRGHSHADCSSSRHVHTFLSDGLPAQGHTLPSKHLIQLVVIRTKDTIVINLVIVL